MFGVRMSLQVLESILSRIVKTKMNNIPVGKSGKICPAAKGKGRLIEYKTAIAVASVPEN